MLKCVAYCLLQGLRLFCDRLVTPAERRWCNDAADEVAQRHFPSMDAHAVLARPVLFSKWLTKNYTNVDKEELRKHLQARLTTFYEEELNVPLVVFDSVLEHATRI